MIILSLITILLVGHAFGKVFSNFKLPSLIGMLLAGILIGPYALNLIDDFTLQISSLLRQIALIIILTRTGLSLDLEKLKKIGRPAILMCFIPATFEIAAILIFGPLLLGITYIEALLLGSVLAAVSPAVVVPTILKIKKEGYGVKKSIPELILAGSSADDIYVIVLFYSFLGLAKNNEINYIQFLNIPISIISAIIFGIILGLLLVSIFKKIKINVYIQTVITLSISIVLVLIEPYITQYIAISSLLTIIIYNLVINLEISNQSKLIEKKYDFLWNIFQIILFVLVGATINIEYALQIGIYPILLLLIALIFRSLGVFIILLKTKLNMKERLFAIISYLPKATVQASIGSIALSEGLAAGEIILTIAVLSIIITAPIGSILMNFTYKKLLKVEI